MSVTTLGRSLAHDTRCRPDDHQGNDHARGRVMPRQPEYGRGKNNQRREPNGQQDT